MGKFDGVMIASDFDDTFFPASHVLPEANRQAVAYFQSQGGVFTIATGRAKTTFRRYVDLARPNAPVILANGAQLYDFSREVLVEERTVPETIADDLLELVKLVPEVGLEAYHGEDIYIWNPNEWTWFHLERAKCTAEECEIAAMPQPWGKAILHQKNSILKEAQRLILERWGDRYEAIFSNFHMLELTGKGTTKGGMVLRLAEKLGVRRENLYCVGDNQNDLPMLAVSAVPYAPADCAQEVKDWGAHLLPPSEDGAIAGLVEELDKRY